MEKKETSTPEILELNSPEGDHPRLISKHNWNMVPEKDRTNENLYEKVIKYELIKIILANKWFDSDQN